jgi:uncharacterized protein
VSSHPSGVENCTVSRSASGWSLEGNLVRRFKKGTAMVTYLIGTDSRWRTKRVSIEQVLQGRRSTLDLEVRGSKWFRKEKEVASVRGCRDVDLQASPVTNSLPIRRGHPKIGETVELTAAWVRFPSLKIAPLRQSYERLGPRTYRYRSAGGFTAELEVDDLGLVRRYGNYWIALDARPS